MSRSAALAAVTSANIARCATITPFGQAGRSRRVELHRDVVGRHVEHRGRRTVARRAIRRSRDGRCARLGGDHELDRLELRLDLLDAREELRADDQHQRGGVVDDLRDLRRGEAPVHGREHGSELRRAEQELEELGHVLVEDRDPVAALDTGGAQRVGHLVRPRVELSVRDRAVLVRDRGRVGPLDARARGSCRPACRPCSFPRSTARCARRRLMLTLVHAPSCARPRASAAS